MTVFKIKTCPCGAEFRPTSGRQVYCAGSCPARVTRKPTVRRERRTDTVSNDSLLELVRWLKRDYTHAGPSDLTSRIVEFREALRGQDLEAMRRALFRLSSTSLCLADRPERIATPRGLLEARG